MNKRVAQKGFTIVELLIVIVIIGILAAITIVAYNGIQNRANDTAVQTDLKSIGDKVNQYIALNDKVPAATSAELGTMNIKVSSRVYGAHYTPGLQYNLIMCRTSSEFILVAASVSGNVFVYRGGGVKAGVGPLVTHTTTCANNGLSTSGSWLYSDSAWLPWITT
jgi:prepilin-type N-terminal cleavage/methylation domain-containing protein